VRERFEWERIRWLACVNMQPHKKKGKDLQPRDLMEFDWEKKRTKPTESPEEQRRRAEYAHKLYEQINKKEDGGQEVID
jgi:hypothetical protein